MQNCSFFSNNMWPNSVQILTNHYHSLSLDYMFGHNDRDSNHIWNIGELQPDYLVQLAKKQTYSKRIYFV